MGHQHDQERKHFLEALSGEINILNAKHNRVTNALSERVTKEEFEQVRKGMQAMIPDMVERSVGSLKNELDRKLAKISNSAAPNIDNISHCLEVAVSAAISTAESRLASKIASELE